MFFADFGVPSLGLRLQFPYGLTGGFENITLHGCLPFPVSLAHTPSSVYWDHLPNKLLVLGLLPEGQLLEEPKLKQKGLFVYSFKYFLCTY